MKNLILLLVIFFTSLACTPCGSKPLPFNAHISNFKESDKDILIEAMAEWNKAFKTNAFMLGGDHNRFDITPYYDFTTDTSGKTNGGTCNVKINMSTFDKLKKPEYRKRTMQAIILHELGHVMGAPAHTTDKNTVLANKTGYHATCIDKPSIDLICQYRDCSGLDPEPTCPPSKEDSASSSE